MASVSIFIWKQKNKSGGYPVTIRIIKDRKTSYIFTGKTLDSLDQWDGEKLRVRKSHPNATRLNNYILKKLAEANDKLLEVEVLRPDTSAKTVKRKIKPQGNDLSFFKHADAFIQHQLSLGKYNRVPTEKSRIKNFREFLHHQDITFPDITVPLLNRFRAHLIGMKGVSERTVINHMILIRTIFNQAIASETIDRKGYPFGKGKIVIKFPESQKVGLSKDEVKKIESVDLSAKPYLNHARHIWLTSFYFAGMRVSDVLRLKWSDFQNGRLYYQMGKNNKVVSLKVPEKAFAILEGYKAHEQKHDLIFPELKALADLDSAYHIQRKISYATKRLDAALTEIAKHEDVKLTKTLTMHIARHTFGHISGDKIPVQVLKDLYRHTDIKTTMGYQANFIHEKADDALDSVINFDAASDNVKIKAAKKIKAA